MLGRMCRHVRRILVVLVLNACLCGLVQAGLAGRFGKIVGKAKQSEYAIRVVQADSQTVVYSHNATKALIPASNMKLITTAAALDYLGPLFEYRTRVGLSGDTLVVIGSGDPLLGDGTTDRLYGREKGWFFDRVVEAIKAQGVTSVTDIVVDTTIFDNERAHPNWSPNDLNRWYACEVCGLNYNANCIDVTTDNRGGVVAIRVEPETSFVEIVNEVKAVSGGASAVGAYRSQQPNRITIRGKCKTQEGPFDVAIEQPGAFFGYVLAERLIRSGIPATGQLIERAFDEQGNRFTELIEYRTPLIDALHRANKDSLGLAAEALLKTIAAHESPDRSNGSWAEGSKRVGDYLRRLGIPDEEHHIDDGSGLSRENRLSARALMTVLLDLYHGDNWELYRTSLAVGGEDGTIVRYFKGSAYRGRVLGKTGYVSGVRSFSGVCLTDRGPYLFSILSNRSSLSRDSINRIAEAIMDEYRDTD